MMKYIWRWFAAAVLTLSILPVTAGQAAGSENLRLVINGRTVSPDPAPVIIEGRTLVPLRVIFETLDAAVDWDEANRTVSAVRGSRSVMVRVDERMACLAAACAEAGLLDVPPQIRESRTFIPLRFVATALGASVHWNAGTRTVTVDGQAGAGSPARAFSVAGVAAGEVVTGPKELSIAAGTEGLPAGAAEVRYLLLDPDTGRGPVVARGADLFGGHQWLPDPVHEGRRLLAAVLYDHNGRFLTGEAVSVRVSPQTSVSLEGVAAGQRITASVSLRPRFNFIATHVRYELVDPATGVVTGIAEADPEATFSWTPGFTHNGTRSLRVTAYDRLGRAHSSAAVSVNVAMARQVSLGGVTTGRTLQRPVTLRTGANFPVQSVRYMLRRAGGDHELARRSGSGTLRWVPEPGQSGAAELFVVVTDGSGAQHASAPVPVTVSAAPGIFVETVGPNQVLAGTVDLRAVTNVSVNRVDYQLIHPGSGAVKTIAGGSDASAVYKWTPASNDAGSWRLRAVAHTAGGQVLTSEELPVRVHTGALFAARPVIAKNQFQDFAANLAVTSQAETGMSAALQVAQAILESGWGQFSPVDKYSGQLSHNLFGIKGSGPAGSVISNTWEEYNGVAYRVDDNFRAYQSVKQSWDDHKRLVLTVSRYAPFRAVMHDGTRGAWALRRAGYATDSQYPLKLINLMKQYDLYRLDDVSP